MPTPGMKLGALLGSSIASSILPWTLAYFAVKGSLKLPKAVWLYLVGYAATILTYAMVIGVIGFVTGADPSDLPDSKFDWHSLIVQWGVPLICGLVVAFLLVPYWKSHSGPSAERPVSREGK